MARRLSLLGLVHLDDTQRERLVQILIAQLRRMPMVQMTELRVRS